MIRLRESGKRNPIAALTRVLGAMVEADDTSIGVRELARLLGTHPSSVQCTLEAAREVSMVAATPGGRWPPGRSLTASATSPARPPCSPCMTCTIGPGCSWPPAEAATPCGSNPSCTRGGPCTRARRRWPFSPTEERQRSGGAHLHPDGRHEQRRGHRPPATVRRRQGGHYGGRGRGRGVRTGPSPRRSSRRTARSDRRHPMTWPGCQRFLLRGTGHACKLAPVLELIIHLFLTRVVCMIQPRLCGPLRLQATTSPPH